MLHDAVVLMGGAVGGIGYWYRLHVARNVSSTRFLFHSVWRNLIKIILDDDIINNNISISV